MKDMTCKVTLFIDDENKDYTVDYIYHSDMRRFHSEGTAVFESLKDAKTFVQKIVRRNKESAIRTQINVEVE